MEERIRRTIAEVFGVPAGAIGEDCSPDTLEQWDSLGHMNLCAALEKEFGIRFTDRQVVSMASYAAIVRTISGTGVAGATA